jgi:hypothetical protein
VNRNQFEEKRHLLGHTQSTGSQSSGNPEQGATEGEGNTLRSERFFEVTKKYLSDQR